MNPLIPKFPDLNRGFFVNFRLKIWKNSITYIISAIIVFFTWNSIYEYQLDLSSKILVEKINENSDVDIEYCINGDN